MGLFDSVTFSPPDFQMGNFGEPFGDFLRRKDRDRLKLREEERFEMDLGRMRQRQELDRMSKVMNPAAQVQPNVVGPKMAPLNPSLDAYRKEQIELGKDKLDFAKEKEQSRGSMAERGMSVRERLAALRDLSDSEKTKLLQDGRITLQEMRDAESMARVERTGEIRTDQIDQQGKIRTNQIEQQGKIRTNQIEQQGKIGSRYITERGDEARKTKTTPSNIPQTAAQRRGELQIKAAEVINRNPDVTQYVTFNEQGLPIILKDAPLDIQMQLYRDIYSSSQGDVNLPAPAPTQQPAGTPPPSTSGVTQPVATQPTVTQPTAVQPNAIPPSGVKVPQMTEGFKPDTPQTINSPSPPNSGMIEMTTPDGRGTRMVPKDKVQIALSQGYKHKGQ